MKKHLVYALAAFGMVACMQEEVVSVQQDAISFKNAYVENATRAEDPSTTWDSIQDFNVWGFMDSPEGYVFTGDKVWRSGSVWTYDNTQYWVPGHTYYFAAVSPAESTNWQLAEAPNTYGPGTLTFTNVDGTEDLLYAATTVTTPRVDDLQAEGMDPVALQFNHLLSKVKFTFKNGFTTDNMKVAVKNIKMTAPAGGSINLAVENWWDNDDWTLNGEDVILNFGEVATLAMGEKDECTNERLTIPVDKAHNYTVSFDIELYVGNIATPALTTEKVTDLTGVALEMGKAYNFSAEINPENLHLPSIEFYVEEVKDWVDAQTPDEQVWESELKAAALLGGTYTLPGNIDLTSPVVVPAGTHFVVDLNGKTITAAGDAFEVAGGNLTINGEGTVYAATTNGEPYCAVWAYGDGYVRINGGEYKIGYPEGDYNDLIYAKENAHIDIYGGYFHNSGRENAFVLNLKGGSNASITVYGGTFEGFNPEDNASENPRDSFVAPGYVAVENNGEWTVYPGVLITNADEFKAAAADPTVENMYIGADINFGTSTAVVNTDKVIYGNGYKLIAGGTKSSKNYGLGFNGVTATVKDLVMVGGGGIYSINGADVIVEDVTLKTNYNKSGRHLFYVENATLTVNSGEYEVLRTGCGYIGMEYDAHVYINGGTWADMLQKGDKPVNVTKNCPSLPVIAGGKFYVGVPNYAFDPTPYLADGYNAERVGNYMVVSEN